MHQSGTVTSQCRRNLKITDEINDNIRKITDYTDFDCINILL